MLNPGFDIWKQRRRNSLPSDCPQYKCSRYSFLMIVKRAGRSFVILGLLSPSFSLQMFPLVLQKVPSEGS